MNLIKDSWLRAVCRDGSEIDFNLSQISRGEIVDLVSVRADFQGALYQFLIGLLQTAFPPRDYNEWEQYWDEPPSQDQLASLFSNFAPAFELFAKPGEPAFLQDLTLSDGEEKSVSVLLIEAPGGKTLKDNLDHFVKGGNNASACPSCAATALFTLQANAPAGGVGHRVGLRGGGPLTTLLLPAQHNTSLWRKLWLNVLTREEFQCMDSTIPHAEVFPWMSETRVSDKTGSATLPEDAHPLQMYWGMPRRIRLKQGALRDGVCSICGSEGEVFVDQFLTRNYGVNYEGPWQHPLTPYRLDSKNEKPPLSLKGQPGGLGYRHWSALNWGNETSGDVPALNVKSFYAEKDFLLSQYVVRLWCFGYDMDNMKARSWYECQMPVLSIPEKFQKSFVHQVNTLISAARDVVKEVRQQVKSAWFTRPKDAKGDVSMIDASFWQATESDFYELLHELVTDTKDLRFMPSAIGKNWALVLRRSAVELFDSWALEGEAESMDMRRISKARRDLLKQLKSMKTLSILDKADEKEAA